jgi:hypothetical protein
LEDEMPIKPDHIAAFTQDWYTKDEYCSLVLHLTDVAEILLGIESPLGFQNSLEYPEISELPSDSPEANRLVCELLLSPEFDMPYVHHHHHAKAAATPDGEPQLQDSIDSTVGAHAQGDAEGVAEFACDQGIPPESDLLVHFVECFSTMVKAAHNRELSGAGEERMEETDVRELKDAAVKIARAFPSLYQLHTGGVARAEGIDDGDVARGAEDVADTVIAKMMLRESQHVQVREIMFDDKVSGVWQALAQGRLVGASTTQGPGNIFLGVDKAWLISVLPQNRAGEEYSSLVEHIREDIEAELLSVRGGILGEEPFRMFLASVHSIIQESHSTADEALDAFYSWVDRLETEGLAHRELASSAGNGSGRSSPAENPADKPEASNGALAGSEVMAEPSGDNQPHGQGDVVPRIVRAASTAVPYESEEPVPDPAADGSTTAETAEC